MKRLTLILTLISSLFLFTISTLAQEPVALTLAAVHEGNVWLYSYNAEPQQITDGTAQDYAHLVWSADRNSLAFFALSEDFSASLWLYNRADESLQQVDSDVLATYPPAFDTDNSQLLYFKDTTPPGETNPVDLLSYDLASATSAQVTSVEMGEGCGGGSSFPADWLYWDETGGLGGLDSVLSMTFTGIVYSKDCGNSTVLLDRTTHEEISLGNLSRVAVSPDGMRLAGISYQPGDRTTEQIVVIDLTSRETAPMETTEIPDQVAWGEAGTNELFYTTRQMTDNAPEFSNEDLERLDAVLDNQDQLNLWEVSIHHLDLDTNTDTEIYRAEAYAVGRLLPVPGADALLFSQVANAERWLTEVGAGRLDNSDPERYQASENFILVQLFRLPTGGELELLGEDLHRVAVVTQ
jgi:hypothetical protein